jgi:hypothetical protein
VLKDIYSPLEIDDQWDQRAPVHEDKAEGGNADGMSTATPEVPVENPSGGVAIMDQPTAESTQAPINPESTQVPEAQEAPVVDPTQAPAIGSEVPGMQTPPDMAQAPAETTTDASATTEAPSEITQFHPEGSDESATPVTMEEPTTEQTPPADEVAPTEATGTETPEQDNDDDAASMLDGTEHDVPASPFDTPQEDSSDPSVDSTSTNEAPESTTAMPITTVEPDASSRRPEVTDDADVKEIVDRPLSDEENERIASENDQLPVVASEKEGVKAPDDNKKARARETLENMKEAIDVELKKLAEKLKDYQDKLAEVEKDIDDTQEMIDAKKAEKDDFEASVIALNAPDEVASTEPDPTQELDQAA